jgi:hypothetical protein
MLSSFMILTSTHIMISKPRTVATELDRISELWSSAVNIVVIVYVWHITLAERWKLFDWWVEVPLRKGCCNMLKWSLGWKRIFLTQVNCDLSMIVRIIPHFSRSRVTTRIRFSIARNCVTVARACHISRSSTDKTKAKKCSQGVVTNIPAVLTPATGIKVRSSGQAVKLEMIKRSSDQDVHLRWPNQGQDGYCPSTPSIPRPPPVGKQGSRLF